MRLTKKRAIQLTIELWEWLAETGLWKGDWDGWKKYGHARGGCFLCEYGLRQRGRSLCAFCPYCQKFGYCRMGVYEKWLSAHTIRTYKKYALKVLEELRQL